MLRVYVVVVDTAEDMRSEILSNLESVNVRASVVPADRLPGVLERAELALREDTDYLASRGKPANVTRIVRASLDTVKRLRKLLDGRTN